jgi:hypothetical protein
MREKPMSEAHTSDLINRDTDRVFPLLWQFLFFRIELNKFSFLRTIIYL